MTTPARDSLLIIVPAYNEEAAVAGVVRSIHAAMPDTPVLVIDDCSPDATQAVAREAGAWCCRCRITWDSAAACRPATSWLSS